MKAPIRNSMKVQSYRALRSTSRSKYRHGLSFIACTYGQTIHSTVSDLHRISKSSLCVNIACSWHGYQEYNEGWRGQANYRHTYMGSQRGRVSAAVRGGQKLKHLSKLRYES